jgi:predicted aspartyl protease
MPVYDGTLFNPPAPVALVELLHPDTGARQSGVVMLVDSGADVTLVPTRVAQQLGVALTGAPKYELAAYDGSVRSAQAVRLKLVFLGRTFHGQFLLVDQEEGVIGRNVLNAVSLVLDGPRLTWQEAGES